MNDGQDLYTILNFFFNILDSIYNLIISNYLLSYAFFLACAFVALKVFKKLTPKQTEGDNKTNV